MDNFSRFRDYGEKGKYRHWPNGKSYEKVNKMQFGFLLEFEAFPAHCFIHLFIFGYCFFERFYCHCLVNLKMSIYKSHPFCFVVFHSFFYIAIILNLFYVKITTNLALMLKCCYYNANFHVNCK